MGYRIKTVSEKTGIPKNTLIAWERRYDLLSPERTESGYRVYSDEDVQTLLEVRGLIEEGYKISEAVSLLKERDALRPTEGAASLEGQREALLAALLGFDHAGAERVLLQLGAAPMAAVVRDVLLPVMVEVGERWESGEATVAQEHFATGMLRSRLEAMLTQLSAGPAGGRRIVCATLPGERHEIGLLAFAVRVALAGHRVTWLGPDLPLDTLVAHVREHQPWAVALSVVRTDALDEVASAVRSLRADLPADVRLIVGGSGLPHDFLQETEGIVVAHHIGEIVRDA